MALTDAGVKLIAEGAGEFLGDMKNATGAVSGFGAEGEKSAGLLSGLGDVIGNVAKVAAGVAVAGFAALAGALTYSVKEAMAAQEIDAQLEAVLKSTGGAAGVTADEARDLASALSETTRFADDTILAGENMLLTFTNIGQDVFPDATAIMLDMAQAMGGDLKGTAIQLGKALNDPVAGVSALSRVGVTFTEEQKKMIAAMVAAGDTAGAQRLVLAELQKEFGGSAVAAGQTFAGQLDILKNSLSNVAEGIGMSLLPFLQSMMDEYLMPLLPVIQAVGEQFGYFLSVLMETGNVGDAFDSLGDGLGEIFGPEVGMAIYQIGGAIQDTFEWMQSNIPIALDFITAKWNELTGAISAAYTQYVAPALAEFNEWLGVKIPAGGNVLVSFWTDTLQPALSAVWNWILTALIPTLAQVAAWFLTNLPIAIDATVAFWNGVLWPALQSVWAWIEEFLLPIFAAWYTAFAENLPGAIQFLTDAWNNVLAPALKAVWEWIDGTLFPALKTFAEWFLTKIPTAIAESEKFWTETFWPALQDVWAWIDANLIPIFEDIAAWLGENIPKAIDAAKLYWEETLLPAIKTVQEYIVNDLLPKFNEIKDWLTDTLGLAISKATSFLGDLKSAWEDISSAIQDAIGWISDLITKLQEVEIPDWLVPGSPPPLAYALWDIADATKDANRQIGAMAGELMGSGLGQIGASITGNYSGGAQLAGATSYAYANTTNYNVSFTGNYQSAPSVKDANDLAYMLGLL